MRCKTGPLTKDELKDFDWRVVVAGSRGYSDEVFFDLQMWKFLKDKGIEKGQVVFISGAAKSGADRMIIDWCKKNDYPWVEFHPKWDDVDHEDAVVRVNGRGREYNVLAGFWRNEEMAEVGNQLITFYDGVSPGTRDMMDRMNELVVPVRCILVTTERNED